MESNFIYKKPYKSMAFYMAVLYALHMAKTNFEWDAEKDALNQEKHGVSFAVAQYAFADTHRVIAEDTAHSLTEERFYCIGAVDGSILTVRFTYRASIIRIIGAGYWRKGKTIYERQNKIQE
jgi:uncharacterized protein